MKKDSELGIIQVYQVNQPSPPLNHHKNKHTTLPIIFKVRFKKGAEPVYINYSVMKSQYTDMLLHYFEQRAFFTNQDDDVPY